MKGFLLDANVLVALLWTRHEHHAAAQAWFSRAAGQGWATCGLTQAAFVRLVSNPAFSSDAVRPMQAVAVLQESLKHPGHRWWVDRWGAATLLKPFGDRLLGHRQVTDACLLGLAMRHEGKLATFDRGIASLLSRKAARAIELVRA